MRHHDIAGVGPGRERQMATADRAEVFTIKDADYDIAVSVAECADETFVSIINRQNVEVITMTLADFRRAALAIERKVS
jgi:hypothetical protein